MRFRRCRSMKSSKSFRSRRGSAALKVSCGVAVVTRSRTESHDLQLYHVAIAASAGVRHVLYAAREEDHALGAPLRDKHCGDGGHTARQSRSERVHGKQDTRLRPHAVLRKAMQSVPEQTPSGMLCWSSAGTPRNLRPTTRRDIVLCPNQGHTCWPGAIHPQRDCTNWCRQPSPPANIRRFDSPLLQKLSQSRRCCASTTPVRHTPPVRTHFQS